MTQEFQRELLRYLVQVREAKQFISVIDATVFDLPEHQLALEVLAKYFQKYKTVPGKANLVEYWDREVKASTQKISREIRDLVDKCIRDMYEPFGSNPQQFKETAIHYAQFKKTKKLFAEFATKIKDGGMEVFSQIHRGMGDIMKLQQEDYSEENRRGTFLLKDYNENIVRTAEGEATFLKKLNKLTAAGGFHSPQLIVFASGPKSFKTGVLLNIALEYVRDGKKVYYADAENGIGSIRNRMYQAMLGCKRDELNLEENKVILREMVKRWKNMGGDFKNDFYPAYKTTTAEVEAELRFLFDTYGWKPDIIFWDYADLFKCTDPKVTEKRLNIQQVYHEIIAINNRWGTFSFTPSQVSQKAIGKAVFDVKDLAEDFGKVANCHAAFAICRTPEEIEEGLARIVPIVQREGVMYKGMNVCHVEIEEDIMQVREVEISAAIGKIKTTTLARDLKDE